ncbi:hypothetical protein Tco_0520720 [Tanacetum coccineum]
MVAHIKKLEGSEGFHQIVDFLNASHIRYVLTKNPTIYVSPIKQFWKTATAITLDNGEIELTTIIDGTIKTVTEGLVVQDEGSTYPIESHHISTSAPSTLQPPVSPTSRRITRQEYVVPWPRSPTPTPVADEVASTSVDVRYGGATTIVIGLKAGKGSGNIDKTPTMPQDSPLLRVNTLGSDEGKKTVKSSQARRRARIIVSDDEDDLEDPSKQGRKMAEIDQDPGISLVQHDAEIQGRYGHDMEFDFDFDVAKEVSTVEKDVSTVEPVSTAGASVTTASVVVSTASPTRNTRVSTANDFTMAKTLVYIRKSAAKDKAKGKIDESKTVKTKTKLQQEQERLDFEAPIRLQAKLKEEEKQRIVRRLQAEEREKYTEAEQARMLAELINQRKRYFAIQRAKERRNKPPTQAQQKTYMSNYIKNIGESEVDRAVPKLAAGSSKRDAEEELDQESSKRQNTNESSELAEEPRDKEVDELSQEEL